MIPVLLVIGRNFWNSDERPWMKPGGERAVAGKFASLNPAL